ncbi:amidohydrolase family protein [Desulfovibrio subterraneus]|uniref:amidohydrolase family protein n=1 Tax=Desulfovibrio subterraneus TaxID=2718620 RepID=UPI0022B93D8C|nr:amidohydrolase family protein [Desulfovibrio subterraneus]WBF68809.1 amidohydrolase family protein [Desulfovibrio subterraneus]
MLTAVRASRVLTMAEQRPASRHGEETPPVSGAVPITDSHISCIHDGVIVAENGVIIDVLPYADFTATYGFAPQNLGAATILPGLINCHCHLELSHLGGIGVQQQGFPAWIGSLLARMGEAVTDQALDAALAEMAATGTVHVADVNGRAPLPVYEAAKHHDVGIDLQLEVFGYAFPEGFTAADLWDFFLSGTASGLPDDVRKRNTVLAGHALYSTHPAALVFAKHWCRSRERHFSVHLAEQADEEEMLLRGTGRLRDMLNQRVLPADYKAPGMRPVAYAAELGLLDNGTLAVHCVHCNDADIDLLRETGTHVCLCPRSNEYIGVGTAPVHKFLDAGLNLCFGTDSLASNHDLNLWNEARKLRDDHGVPTHALLRMLTVNGAHALGLSDSLGTLEPGRHFRYAVLPEDLLL